MNSFQKVIKYIAMIFAGFLAFGILATIISGIIWAGTLFGRQEEPSKPSGKPAEFSEVYTDISSLDIRNVGGTLTIRSGDSFRVEGRGLQSDFSCKDKNGTLVIRNDFDPFPFFSFSDEEERELTIYLPEDFTAEKVSIVNEIGTTYLDGIDTERLYLENGAGALNASRLSARKTRIECGAGSCQFTDSDFENLSLETGIGKFDFEGTVTGKSTVECGIGKTTLNLTGSRFDYDITAEQGIGSVSVDGNPYQDEEKAVAAPNTLSVEGGIGKIDIRFQD